jgi:hypothetical protein
MSTESRSPAADASENLSEPDWLQPPGTGGVNDTTSTGANFALGPLDSSANQYTLGTKYNFNKWVTWYLVGSYVDNGPGAHYCLGVSGHGYSICGRDANNNVIAGDKIKAVSTGMTLTW